MLISSVTNKINQSIMVRRRPPRGNSNAPLPIRVVSRRLVKASDASIEPHISAVHNMDLIPNSIQCSITCIYPKPVAGDFGDVVAAFESHLPCFLNYFFPMTGRIVYDPATSIPELHCLNQGTELVVGDVVGVDLGSLDWGLSEHSLKKIFLPYAQDLPLSVQLLSFACGGFAVVWATNNLIGDGNVGVMLVRMWAELVRNGGVSEAVPCHDRSLLGRPRSPPTYSGEVAEMFRPWDHENQVNALTAEESLVERLYYVEGRDLDRLRVAATAASGVDGQEASEPPATRVQAFSAYLWKILAGVVDASRRLQDADKRCRMLWWVDGRRRFSPPDNADDERRRAAALNAYAGNVTLYVTAEAAATEVLRRPLPEVAGMVREAITCRDYDELAQGVTDWVEVHKPQPRFIEAPAIGLGSPTVGQTMWSSFTTDADFGFGQASLVLPVENAFGRMCSGLLCIAARPGDGSGSWILSAEVWPSLAAALEEDDERIFRPLTAEYLGLSRANYLLRDHAAKATAATARSRL